MPRSRHPKQYVLAVAAFKNMARYTWRTLAGRHQLNMRWPEVAITNELVYRLAKAKLPHVQIYEALNERIYGHDIDLYIEVLPGRYVHFSLQAKVMVAKPSYKPYPAIDHVVENKKAGTSSYQWELLNQYQTERIPFYLFYNGFEQPNYQALTGFAKRRMPRLSGCSVMHLADFKDRFLTPGWQLKGHKGNINYQSVNEDATGPNAVPWHHLFDAVRWLKAAATTNGGTRIKTYSLASLLNDKLYRKLQPSSADVIHHEFEDFPFADERAPNITRAAFRILVSMSDEDLSESHRRKLLLLLAAPSES